MDFLSEATKKEKRNLLAAGFAGIILGQLKIIPSEMDVVGLKFHSPDLPLIAVGSLCVAIIYFLIKFCFSYLYEQSSAKTQALAMQIREGKTAMDIAREEETLNDLSRHLIEQRKRLQAQQDHEEKRIGALQDKIDQDDMAHEATLKAMEQKRSDLEQALAGMDLQLVQNYLSTTPTRLISKDVIEKEISMLKESLARYFVDRSTKRQEDVKNLENEKNNRRGLYEAQLKKFNSDEEAADDKRKSIVEWKRAHTTVGIVSPFHRSLELYLPIGVGVVAIISLIYLMLHFPPPKPPSLPEF